MSEGVGSPKTLRTMALSMVEFAASEIAFDYHELAGRIESARAAGCSDDEIAEVIGKARNSSKPSVLPWDPAFKALVAFANTIQATGGLVYDEAGQLVPHADRDWYDLARAYELACEALGQKPVVREP